MRVSQQQLAAEPPLEMAWMAAAAYEVSRASPTAEVILLVLLLVLPWCLPVPFAGQPCHAAVLARCSF